MTPASTYLKGTKSMFGLNGWIIAILVLFISTSAFATDKTAPDFKGIENFKKAFPQATEITVEQKRQYTMVNFTWNGMKLQAFYDAQGNSLGTSRQIPVSNLPLSYMVSIQKEYPGYDFVEAIEFDHINDELSYYVTVSSPEKSYVLKISSEGNISVFKKMKH